MRQQTTICPERVTVLRDPAAGRAHVYLWDGLRQTAPSEWDGERYAVCTDDRDGLAEEVAAHFGEWLARAEAEERTETERAEKEERYRRDAASAAAAVFIRMAEAGQIDDRTVAGHPSLFLAWDQSWTGRAGTILSDEGKLYRSLQDVGAGQNTKPGDTPAMWAQVADPAEEWPEWNQPLGAFDAYQKGAKTRHGSGRWVSVTDGNVWEPGVYGWEVWHE